MKGLLFLLYCIEILGAQLCGAQNVTDSRTNDFRNGTNQDDSTTTPPTDLSIASTGAPEASSLMSTQSSTTITQVSISPLPNLSSTTHNVMFYWKECLPVLMVTGGLIIACTILLVSTLLLGWKVCQLSRHIKALSSNSDLISNTEYWVESAKRNKGKSETEPKETSVLMADVSQTQEEVGNGTTEEGGGKVKEDKKKEVGDTANSEEASATPVVVAENSSSSKPQEEVTDPQSTKDVAAPTPEGSEEPKDVV